MTAKGQNPALATDLRTYRLRPLISLNRDGVRVLEVEPARGEDITATYVVEAESLTPKRVPREK